MTAVEQVTRTITRRARRAVGVARRKPNGGYCAICGKMTLFVEEGPWLRDQYRCIRCRSIPRWRALVTVLNDEFPDWRTSIVHESSPGGPASDRIRVDCKRYSSSHYFPHAAPGALVDGVRCENLEHLTFPDESIDIFVTQDVLEHVLRPDAALREIARVLRPGGAHVFTVPVFWGRKTLLRAEPDEEGGVRHLLAPERHGNPIDPNGSLVIREWGEDLFAYVRQHTGLDTSRHHKHDRHLGLDGAFLDVFITRRLRS